MAALVLLFLTLLLGSNSLALPSPQAEVLSKSTSYIPGSTRIVGGVEATPHEYPHIVSLRLYGSHWCGGSIINSRYILTAAHCLDYFPTSGYSISAGDHILNSTEGTEQVRSVSAKIYHSSYGSPTIYSNDIALVRLSSPLSLNSYVRVAMLPPNTNFTTPPTATVSGWGDLRQGSGAGSNVLMKVTVPFVSASSCQRSYPDYEDQLMVCYGESGKDSCQGDSGGPLMCGSANSLCGVVSYGQGCAQPGYPGVYTRVSTYISWINNQVNT